MTLETIKLFFQNLTEVIVSIATLGIVLTVIGGLLITVFRPRQNIIESIVGLFFACVAAIVLVRMVPPLVVGSSLDAVRNSRESSVALNREINGWLWSAPDANYTPSAATSMPLPPLFPPTETPAPQMTATPVIVTPFTPVPTATPLPTATATVAPVIAQPTSSFPPTPAIVTRTP
jgi:hypothetical protein